MRTHLIAACLLSALLPGLSVSDAAAQRRIELFTLVAEDPTAPVILKDGLVLSQKDVSVPSRRTGGNAVQAEERASTAALIAGGLVGGAVGGVAGAYLGRHVDTGGNGVRSRWYDPWGCFGRGSPASTGRPPREWTTGGLLEECAHVRRHCRRWYPDGFSNIWRISHRRSSRATVREHRNRT